MTATNLARPDELPQPAAMSFSKRKPAHPTVWDEPVLVQTLALVNGRAASDLLRTYHLW